MMQVLAVYAVPVIALILFCVMPLVNFIRMDEVYNAGRRKYWRRMNKVKSYGHHHAYRH